LGFVSSALDRRISTAAPTTLSSASDVTPQFTPPTSLSLAMSISSSAGTEAPLRGTQSPALDLDPIHLPAPPALPRRLTLCPAPLHPLIYLHFRTSLALLRFVVRPPRRSSSERGGDRGHCLELVQEA
ncbi:hypothetical protein LINPERPRIM_LOCUS1391, partial [Linum perenne]